MRRYRLRCVTIVGGFIAAALTVGLPARVLLAQTTAGSCTVVPGTLAGADACTKARDLFAFVLPQVGVALSGGNPILGEGGTAGGWGKIVASARLSAVDGRLPKTAVPVRLSQTATADDFGTVRAPIPVPSVDAAIGVLKGIPLGLTNVGGVDALVSVTYVPSVAKGPVELATDGGNVAVGYGVRVGLLQESALVPGIGVSWMRRSLPTLDLQFRGANDTLAIRQLGVSSQAIRLTASKRLLLVGLAAGVGQDRIDGTASVSAAVNESVGGSPQRAAVSLPSLRTRTVRNTAFVNASFSLLIARLVGELGWSSAGAIEQTTNRFGSRQANEAYGYGSVGLTLRF